MTDIRVRWLVSEGVGMATKHYIGDIMRFLGDKFKRREILDIAESTYDLRPSVSKHVTYISGGSSSEVLMFVNLRGISNQECRRWFLSVHPSTVCAQYYNTTAQSACSVSAKRRLVFSHVVQFCTPFVSNTLSSPCSSLLRVVTPSTDNFLQDDAAPFCPVGMGRVEYRGLS